MLTSNQNQATTKLLVVTFTSREINCHILKSVLTSKTRKVTFYRKLNNRKEKKCRFDRQCVRGALKHFVLGWAYLEESELRQTTPHFKLPSAGERTEMLQACKSKKRNSFHENDHNHHKLRLVRNEFVVRLKVSRHSE